ncbi:asparaginase [Candidatus Microgenomates bacterium]|nr:asparaginase [Candidatus Microgenomates bacterium]
MIEETNKKILVVMTGGTIDFVWDEELMGMVPAEHSAIPGYFVHLSRNSNFPENLTFKEVCMKDSRDLTSEDRKNILDTIERADAANIIITHGIYTMPTTAKYLKLNLKRKDQTIILTGATTPLKGFSSPVDASFNLGFAMVEACSLSAGIYICINARVFTAKKVDLNIFQSSQPQAILLDTQKLSNV